MSKPGVEKCFSCGKTVYHAERKEHDKNIFHASCFNKWWKEKQATGTGVWGGSYDKSADVQPAYYRTDDGQGARMESGADYKTAPAGAAASNFCGQCGTAASGAKFCQQCGTKL